MKNINTKRQKDRDTKRPVDLSQKPKAKRDIKAINSEKSAVRGQRQRGEIGTRLDLPEIGQFCYRLSAADLRWLKKRKKTFQKNNGKTDKQE